MIHTHTLCNSFLSFALPLVTKMATQIVVVGGNVEKTLMRNARKWFGGSVACCG
jgi:hypothetical protein